jgi:DNA-binding GntR family transcriptional regulator
MSTKETPIKKKGGEVDRVYRLLKSWILNCRFRPSDFLPEAEVAAQCKTSRTPVREACNRLAEEKWLSKIQNRGYIVCPISAQDILEVYEYRKLLECFTVERTAQTATPEDIAALKDIIAVENKPNAKVSDFVTANYALHTRIGRLAQNQRIYDQLTLMLEYVHRLDILSTPRDSGWVTHGEILAALEAHDVKGAGKAMAEHIDIARDHMLGVFFRGEMPKLRANQVRDWRSEALLTNEKSRRRKPTTA